MRMSDWISGVCSSDLEFTGMENIRSALVYNGLIGDAVEEAVADIVDFCELGDFIDQPVKTYSLGMRARLQFAAASSEERRVGKETVRACSSRVSPYP